MTTVANTRMSLEISASLEDYLETIYLLAQQHGFARVKDIARARDVKAASVSVALRKLAEQDLVRYERREYVTLTESGEEAGRRVLSRHRLLTRFFEEVLGMSTEAAGDQACAMEHCLTDEAMDRFVRFFEFIGTCPSVVHRFREYEPAVNGVSCPHTPCSRDICAACPSAGSVPEPAKSLADLKSGESGLVTQVGSTGAIRQRLLDMGILPNTMIDLERVGLGGDPLWIRCHGAQLALRRAEAKTIRIKGTKS